MKSNPRVLVLSDRFPDDLTSGRHLRVYNLCNELAREYECYFIALAEDRVIDSCAQNFSFQDSMSFCDFSGENRAFRRHLRLSNAHFIGQTWPRQYRDRVAQVLDYARTNRVGSVVNFAPLLGEYSIATGLPRLLDITDCDTLTIERQLRSRGSGMSFRDSIAARLQLVRQRQRERWLASQHTKITTIAEPDRRRLLDLSGVDNDKIEILPNGVGQEVLRQSKQERVHGRSIVFWGNLDFPPNWTAVKYFYDEVFVPYLVEHGVHWHIIGRGAGSELDGLADHSLVHMEGFQEDLPGFVADKGVMINPMVEGSGLKNKVLESFAMGLPVVTTSLGVEAIDGQAGEHFLIADTPEEFAGAILRLLDDKEICAGLCARGRELVENRYIWRAVGAEFRRIVSALPMNQRKVGSS
jgi:glycosyltransferase involved in cell wall biosynthesis